MPKSKHRRKGQVRPRPRQLEPQKVNPPPSPRWLPATGAILLVVGVGVIILGYLDPIQRITVGWGWLGLRSNWPLVGGFAILITGFGLLTRWR